MAPPNKTGALHVLSTVNTSPGWQMAGKPKEPPCPSHPGPGEYTPDEAHNSMRYHATRTYKFSVAPRDGPAKPPVPGPGEYNPGDTKSSSARFVFGTTPRATKSLKTVAHPSPAEYTVEGNLGQYGPKFSLRPRSELLNHPKTPGPGTYNHEAASTGKSDRFGHRSSPRFGNSSNGVPAPGEYSPRGPTARDLKYSFGTSKRGGGMKANNCPSPASYMMTPHIGEAGPKYSCGGRLERPTGHEVPGPGMYEPRGGSASIRSSSRSHAFGMQSREVNHSTHAPGPGHYESKAETRGGSSFPKSARINTMRQHVTPAPGHYSHHTQFVS